MLIYNAHLIPINQDFDFFNKFINYAIINKDFYVFEKGLNYIRDIETFLKVIDKNKEDIFKKYNNSKFDKIIKFGNLKFQRADREENKPKITLVNKNKICSDIFWKMNIDLYLLMNHLLHKYIM